MLPVRDNSALREVLIQVGCHGSRVAVDSRHQMEYLVTEGAASHCLIIHTIRRDRSGSVWIDEAPNVSRPDRSGADQIATKLRPRWRAVLRRLRPQTPLHGPFLDYRSAGPIPGSGGCGAAQSNTWFPSVNPSAGFATKPSRAVGLGDLHVDPTHAGCVPLASIVEPSVLVMSPCGEWSGQAEQCASSV
jgi:hypothetical protein